MFSRSFSLFKFDVFFGVVFAVTKRRFFHGCFFGVFLGWRFLTFKKAFFVAFFLLRFFGEKGVKKKKRLNYHHWVGGVKLIRQ